MSECRTISVSTNKGGVLKTSLVTNLAGIYATQGKRVLIIDTDNQGNVSVTFNVNPDECEYTVYDVLLKDVAPSRAIVNVYANIDILPSNDSMSFFELDLVREGKNIQKPFTLLKTAIESLKRNYDVILVDTPPTLGLIQGNVLAFVDEVIIPFQPEAYSMRSLIKIRDTILDFKESHNPNLRIAGVVGTLVDARTKLHKDVMKSCESFCSIKSVRMFETQIPRSVKFATSVAYEGLPATLTDDKHKIVKAYKNLEGELRNE